MILESLKPACLIRHIGIRQIGHVNREGFVSKVRGLLNEFNLSAEDKEKAVKECVRVMRGEKLITR